MSEPTWWAGLQRPLSPEVLAGDLPLAWKPGKYSPMLAEIWAREAKERGEAHEQPSMDDKIRARAERYEALANAFYEATGMIAPGKDVSPEEGGPDYETRVAEWRKWMKARAPLPPDAVDVPPP